MSLQEVKAKTTSTEFLEWMAYLELEREQPTKEDFYLAQIAAEMRRSFVTNPNQVKVENFILKFTDKKSVQEMNPETRLQNSKNFWGAIANVNRPKHR